MKVNFIKIIIIVFSVLYNNQIQAQEVLNNENRRDSAKTIQLESFSDFPNEIDGCSCCFSKSQEEYKKKMYVFVNDFAVLAFVKIDGKLIRFELQNHDENSNIYYYIHNDDKMKVEIIKKTTKTLNCSMPLDMRRDSPT